MIIKLGKVSFNTNLIFKRDFENDLIKKLNAKICLKYIQKTFKKVNDVSVLRYAIIVIC